MMQNASVLSLAVLAGWGATQFRLPLAWVLAPMLVVAFASMLGLRMPEINSGRKLGQLIVGSAIGLTMTSDGLGYIVSWLPLMLLTTLIAIGITVFLTVPFARLSGQSKVTAFFSLTPGGLSEMAKLGNSVGAKSEVVALAQAVRVSIIVLLLPLLLRHYGEDGAIYSGKVRSELSFITYLLVLVISFGSVQIIRLFRVNNP